MIPGPDKALEFVITDDVFETEVSVREDTLKFLFGFGGSFGVVSPGEKRVEVLKYRKK